MLAGVDVGVFEGEDEARDAAWPESHAPAFAICATASQQPAHESRGRSAASRDGGRCTNERRCASPSGDSLPPLARALPFTRTDWYCGRISISRRDLFQPQPKPSFTPKA